MVFLSGRGLLLGEKSQLQEIWDVHIATQDNHFMAVQLFRNFTDENWGLTILGYVFPFRVRMNIQTLATAAR